MNFTLIVCTYMRPSPLLTLLNSVKEQTLYPNEILIIDGSTNNETKAILEKNKFQNLHYFKVQPENRGLTKQRNYGITKTGYSTDIICFLDDDIVLTNTYFENLLNTYNSYPSALGVGGFIIDDDVNCEYVGENYKPNNNEFYFDGWKRKEGSRFIMRKKLGLDSDCPPGFSSLYSHGRSVGFLPPSGKIYEVEQLMGGVSSFKKTVFDKLQFSTYFQGYGLYEDADFSIRAAKTGKLYLNTTARLYHYHAASGRPNQYQYGKMVVRNGWFVWRTKNPKPLLNAKIKWHAITILLTLIRYSNVLTTSKKKQAFTEALGRTAGWFSLWLKKPK